MGMAIDTPYPARHHHPTRNHTTRPHGPVRTGRAPRVAVDAAEYAVVYAIGDVHGCLDALIALEEQIVADAAAIEGRKLLGRLQSLSERLDSLAGAAGEGLAGSTLPRFNLLLQELTTTSRQLSELLDEIDSSPQMLILGRGKPLPGPGEAGFREPAQ